ncbi:MAG TPA: hypothetical protein VFC64_02585 [Atopostipes sp.]|nr:hypothetical protein [Atopostipes sp.]
MTRVTIDNYEWTSLMVPEERTKKETDADKKMVKDYLTKLENEPSIELDAVKVEELTVDDSLIESQETEFERLANNDLFNYFQSEKEEIDAQVLFPKMEKINNLYWFLHALSKKDTKNKKLAISNPDDVTVAFYQLVEAATFFGFMKRTVEDDTFYFSPTKRFEEFAEADLEQQYHLFLAGLGTNETISEIIQIQLNEPLYDTISKRMVQNILVKDPNLQAEDLTNDDIKKIINSFRYWYLGISQMILKN